MLPSNVNNALRELMAHLKDMDAGTQALTSPQLTSVDINGGTIDGAVIGGSSAAAISGTTLALSGNADLNGDLDVDGTTNLDVVDIDGAVNMATTALVTGVLTTTAATVFNGGFAAGGVGTFADGSAGAPSITNTGDVNTGTFFPAADAIGFSTGGTERMRVTTDNLLLSQTAPSQDFGDGRVFISMKGRESADYSGVQMANYGTTGNDQNLGILAFWDGTTSENARIAAQRESATTDAGLLFYTRPTGGSLTERVRIDHDGDVTVKTGDLVFGAAGKGIVLGATTNVAANTLDDYETGSASSLGLPSDGTGFTSSGVTFGGAKYVKIGALVNVRFSVTFAGTSGNWTAGDGFYITGMPFTNNSVLSSGSCWASAGWTAGNRVTGIAMAYNNSTAYVGIEYGSGVARSTILYCSVTFNNT